MTTEFSVLATSHFHRTYGKLVRHHPQLPELYKSIVSILQTDPYNHTRSYHIKKLEGIVLGKGQYRIRAGRFRFRYDIEGSIVYLKGCALRREETYR